MRHRLPVALSVCLLSLVSPLEAGSKDDSTTLDQARAVLKGIQERGGMVMATDPFGEGASTLKYLDQGWGVFENALVLSCGPRLGAAAP